MKQPPTGFAPPWPDLAIGCGRASALVTLGLKRLSRGHTRAVQILDPRWRRHRFDALIVPEHDGLSGDNVITSLGGLNAINDAWLAAGRARFPALAALPGPRTAVLIGGPVADVPFDHTFIETLLGALDQSLARDGGSLLLTCSRRTPPALAQQLRTWLGTRPGQVWRGPQDGDNPYAGLLGHADRIVVTPDSSNLLAEACAVGIPVFTPMPGGLRGKRAALVQALIQRDHIRPLQDLTLPWSRHATPLRELPRVAAQLAAHLGLAPARKP